MQAAHKILIVEDDREMGATLREGFEIDHYDVTLAEDGGAALQLAQAHPFDAVVLDVMLPVFDGYEVTCRLRAQGYQVPIVMLTARDSVADIVHGFDVGIADYVTKPFSFLELSARVRSLIRRSAPAVTLLAVGELLLDTASHEVTRNGQRLPLTRSEFTVLEILMRNAGRVVMRRDLLHAVWGPSAAVEQNNLDVTMSALRGRLDRGSTRRFIQTVRGFGYRLDPGGGQ